MTRFAAFASLALLLTACSDYELVPDDRDNDVIAGLPVCVAEVSPEIINPPFAQATFDGSGSYNPEGGEIVSWAWEFVSVPLGSTVTMPAGGATRSVTPDQAGAYVAMLTVTNDAGVSNDCEVTLTAAPSQDMWVEMYWQFAPDDMDLHLLAPGGTLESDSDCYFANCTYDYLDWGTYGNSADDPSLDLDDIPGTGPENINIDAPSPGQYTVVVHDYVWGSDVTSGNNVTVNIYLGGSRAWSDTRTISGEGTYTEFARIDWTNQTVTGL